MHAIHPRQSARARLCPERRTHPADIWPQPLVGAGTVALALPLLAAAWTGTPGVTGASRASVLLALGLVAATVAAYQFPLHLHRHAKVYMASVPYYLLAVCAPPALAATAAAVGALAGELSVRARRGNRASAVASEVGRRALVVLLGALVAHLPGSLTAHTLALVGTAVTLGAGDIATAPLVLAPMNGARPLRTVVAVAREAYLMEGAQYLLALLGALAAERQGWAVLLLAAPTTLVYLAFRNVARAHEARQAAEAAQAQAEAARQVAEAATRTRDDFLTGAAHELRTPLTNILGRGDLMRARLDTLEGPTGDWLRGQARSLRASAERLAATVEEMTDVAQAHLGQPASLHRDRVDVGALAHAVTGAMAGRAAPVLTQAAPGVVVEGDRAALTRVLQTIIGQACRDSPAPTPIRVEVGVRGPWAVLTVCDRGAGIPAADLPHLFTPFHGVAGALGATGAGLGLAGAKVIVEQHGGAIRVESAVGVGTTVTILLPCACGTGRDQGDAAMLAGVEKRGASAQGELASPSYPSGKASAKDAARAP